MINTLTNYLGEEWSKRLGVKILVRNQLHSPKSEGMNAKTNVSNLSEGEDSGTQEKGGRKKVSLITIKTGKPTVAFWVRVEDGNSKIWA